MKKALLFAKMFLINILLYSQTGELKITVIDEATNETIPFVAINLLSKNTIVSSGSSDINGSVTFIELKSGKYNVKAAILGYQPLEITNVIVSGGKTSYVSLKMSSTVIQGKEIVIQEYKMPLIDPGSKCSKTVTREAYQSMAAKNPSNIVSQAAGVFQRDHGSNISIRGGRTNQSTNVFIDGMRVIGGTGKYNQISEEYKNIVENDFQKAKRNPLSTFSVDVDKAAYANVRRIINDGFLPPKDAVRIEEMINYFQYDYQQPKEDLPFSINLEYSACPWNLKHNLVHIGLQGKKIMNQDLPPNNLVFLIDVSGSMGSSDKLPLLKNALEMLVENLRPIDKVSIVVYAGAAGEVLPSTNNKNKILEAINKLDAGGSTAGGEGIILAYKIAKNNFLENGNNRVILATDGDFNVGISSDDELVRLIEEERNQDIFLSVLGFGSGNLKDSKMEQLADKGNGNYAYIDNLLEAKKVLVKEMGSTLFTIAKDVKIQIEFNPAIVKSYRLIGYENRKLNDEDFNDDSKDAGEIGSGHTVTALYEIVVNNKINNDVDSSIDSLKYQVSDAKNYSNTNELLTVKFRYKEPKERRSKLITKTLTDSLVTFEKASQNLKFSSMVAAFGQNLRDSKYKGKITYTEIVEGLKQTKGLDKEGYRAELIRLVETAEILEKKTASSK